MKVIATYTPFGSTTTYTLTVPYRYGPRGHLQVKIIYWQRLRKRNPHKIRHKNGAVTVLEIITEESHER